MSNLIPVNYDGEKQTVSGRELHEFIRSRNSFQGLVPADV